MDSGRLTEDKVQVKGLVALLAFPVHVKYKAKGKGQLH